MGAVHGVYLKYVGLSALSYAGYAALATAELGSVAAALDSLGAHLSAAAGRAGVSTVTADGCAAFLRALPSYALAYSALLNGAVAVLFKLRSGMGMLGKCPETGQIPLWSYAIFFPFHAPTYLYTHVHTRVGTYKAKRPDGRIEKESVPVASEVQPGWWVGGCYAYELNRDWSGVVDLTVEFPERLAGRTRTYLLLPTWDGVPCTPDQLEKAATYAVEARKDGDVLVHCAHGRGRSTTVMCACLVKAGLYDNWEEALERGIKPGRPVCKLNASMREALRGWQEKYVDGRKKQ